MKLLTLAMFLGLASSETKRMANGCMSELQENEDPVKDYAKEHLDDDDKDHVKICKDVLKWFPEYHQIYTYTTTGSGL